MVFLSYMKNRILSTKGGFLVKVVFASTPDQEEKIQDLIRAFYRDIFPLYYSDHDIKEFERLQVLHTTTRHFEYFGTLKEAYQVITSLQTLISILEKAEPQTKYKMLFQNNAAILKEFGIFFPFEFEQFIEAKNVKNELFSIYSKAANELLI